LLFLASLFVQQTLLTRVSGWGRGKGVGRKKRTKRRSRNGINLTITTNTHLKGLEREEPVLQGLKLLLLLAQLLELVD
jgi:hypothetical protein